MSIGLMNWVWDHSKAEGTELLVLLAMADYAGDNGWCFPRQETLAQRCRVTVRTIQRAIEQLETLGEIEVQRRARINWYKVIGDRLSSDDKDVAIMSDKMSPLTRHPRRLTHDTGVASKEPPINHQRTTTRDASLKNPNPQPTWQPTNHTELEDLPEKHVEPVDPQTAKQILAGIRRRNVDG